MYYFIVNYMGGGGKARKTWNRVHELLKNKEIEYKAYVTKYPGHAGELAAKISSLDEDDIRLVVVGGDGSINEVLNGIVDFEKIRFGVIPTGSGNDFARGLGITKDPDKALDNILSSVEGRTIDLGVVTTGSGIRRIFGISSGIGLDAIVCKRALTSKLKKAMNKLGMGSLTYILLTVATLFSMETYDVRVRMSADEGSLGDIDYFDKLIFFAAMNTFAEGGGVPMNPKARPDDGRLSTCAVSGVPKWRTFLALPILVKARHEGKKGFYLNEVSSVTFDADRPMVLHADGEYIDDTTHIDVDILKGVLNVMV